MVTITAVAMNAIIIDPPGSSEAASVGGCATPPTGAAAAGASWTTSAAQEAATLFIVVVLSCSGFDATLPVEQEGRGVDVGGEQNIDGTKPKDRINDNGADTRDTSGQHAAAPCAQQLYCASQHNNRVGHRAYAFGQNKRYDDSAL